VGQFVAKSQLDWFAAVMLCIIRGRRPDAMTAGDLAPMAIHGAPGFFSERLDAACARGYLTKTDGAYSLSETGEAETATLLSGMVAAIEDQEFMPPAESLRLAELLGIPIQAALNAMASPEPWLARQIHQFAPSGEFPTARAASLLQAMSTYRMDCHRLAWQARDLSPTAADCLTWIWKAEAHSAHAIHLSGSLRSHPIEAYLNAFGELIERGLITGNEAHADITDSGKILRDEIEADTNRRIEAVWNPINDGQRAELADLLGTLHKAVA